MTLLLLLALLWPPGPPPPPCGVIPDNGAPWWRISIGDNPQWLPCPSAEAPTPPIDYQPVRYLPLIAK